MNLASQNKVRQCVACLYVFQVDHGQCIYGHI